MLKIRKITQCVLVAILLAGYATPAFSQTIIVADFEGAGYADPAGTLWGIQQTPAWSLSTNPDWADNGPSLPGDECFLLYPLGPPDGPPDNFGTYNTFDLVASGKSGSYKQLQLTYDIKAVWKAVDHYWMVWINFDDATSEQFNYIPQYTLSASNVWLQEGPFLYDISDANQSKTIESVFLKTFIPICPGPNYWVRFDNIVVRAVPLTGPDNCTEAIQAGYTLNSDLNDDCYVDLADFAVIANEWLDCILPYNPDCTAPWE